MLVMAPEGTTGDGRCILQFRTGAFVPGVPVLPVCLHYGKRCHNPAWTHRQRGLALCELPPPIEFGSDAVELMIRFA